MVELDVESREILCIIDCSRVDIKQILNLTNLSCFDWKNCYECLADSEDTTGISIDKLQGSDSKEDSDGINVIKLQASNSKQEKESVGDSPEVLSPRNDSEKPVSKGWEKTVHQLDNAIHIHPVADLIQHEVYVPGCLCHPSIQFINGWSIVTHRSWDGRELKEKGIPSN